MLLEEIAKKETIRFDPHSHGQTGDKYRSKNSLLGEGFSKLTDLLERVANSGLDIIYITDTVVPNKDNQRFANWTNQEQIQKAVEDGWEIELGNYYVFAAKGQGENRKVIALGHSVEFESKEMHFVAAGVKRDSKYEFSKKFSLDEAIVKLNDNELTMGEKYSKKLKAVQVDSNFYLPFSIRSWMAKRNGRKNKVPVVYSGDGHHPKDIGNTYNILNPKNLKYNSEKTFRDSINSEIMKNEFSHHYSPIPPWRIFHHVFMMGVFGARNLYRKILRK
ncbi:MAG: hypothetical protein Q7S06_01210 [Nanoarchaeota archaeon]|nr:hypothetical protein [Nanoarchaeota archaeon]